MYISLIISNKNPGVITNVSLFFGKNLIGRNIYLLFLSNALFKQLMIPAEEQFPGQSDGGG